jgi:hypothetical protein
VPSFEEKTMIGELLTTLLARLAAAKNVQRDTYPSASPGLADLERRSRYFEANHAPFCMPYDDRRRDGRD